MPLIKDKEAVDTSAVEAAQADAQETLATASDSAGVLEPDEAPQAVLQEQARPEPTQATAVATASVTTNVAHQRQSSQAAVLHEMAEAGHEGLHMDFSSFPGIVLKDGEFQVTGSTRCFSAQLGFSGVVTGSREKFAYRVGGDDDGDVVFANDKSDFTNPEKEACQKIAEWRAAGLKPELKTYLECYTMITTVHDPEAADLVGELVVVQISPTSVGRYSGYAATQKFKHGVMPDGMITHFLRGEKITSGKFPYYPWAFKFGGLAD